MNHSYLESNLDLSVRIEAHKKYSNAKIEDYLTKFLSEKKCKKILDVGCGSGNFSPIFSDFADLYVGFDKMYKIVNAAKSKLMSIKSNSLLLVGDMDVDLNFKSESFDLIAFIYSIYYSNKAQNLIQKAFDLLERPGFIMIFGPQKGNAIELDIISQQLFGIPFSKEKKERTSRLKDEFMPLIDKIFDKSYIEELDFSLEFPNHNEYVRYYLATPQYRELAKLYHTRSSSQVAAIINKERFSKLTKKSLFVTAIKK